MKRSTAKQLSIDTLGDLQEGMARAIVDKALADAIADVEDRAADDQKTRSVQIQVDIWRMADGEVGVDLQCKFSPPKYKTHPTRARLRQVGPGKVAAMFQPATADNPEQEELPYPADDGRGQ